MANAQDHWQKKVAIKMNPQWRLVRRFGNLALINVPKDCEAPAWRLCSFFYENGRGLTEGDRQMDKYISEYLVGTPPEGVEKLLSRSIASDAFWGAARYAIVWLSDAESGQNEWGEVCP